MVCSALFFNVTISIVESEFEIKGTDKSSVGQISLFDFGLYTLDFLVLQFEKNL
jgi:hypothetical protein